MSEILTYPFCEDYLENVASYLENHYLKKNKDLSRLAICFGGKRPQLFLKKKLAQKIQTNFFPPKFFTIDEFIRYIYEKKRLDRFITDLNSCYLIYRLAQHVASDILEKRQSFELFLPWAREILKFIDHLDLENIDDERLLNIQANADIGYDVPTDVNQLLRRLSLLRQEYHKELENHHLISRGLQYLKAAQEISDISFEEFDQILFCNFFYFHQTEEKIIKDLYRRGKATLIFQGDERKWPVLKRIAKSFECSLYEQQELAKPVYNLKLYAGFDKHSQAGVVREIVKNVKNPDESVIVLPHAESLVPLLTQVAPVVEDLNVSLGYSLKRSSLYTLLTAIFKAQLTKKKKKYYARDYLKVLQSPFIKNLKFSEDSIVSRILVHKIEEILTGKEESSLSGSLFIDLNEMESLEELYEYTQEMLSRLAVRISSEKLSETLKNIHAIAFKNWEGLSQFSSLLKVFKSFLDILVAKSFIAAYPLNGNIMDKFYAVCEECADLDFREEHFSQEEMFKIFGDKLSREMISFVGTPLKGLQILGLFETRSLNFKDVIIVDVNESSLPSLAIHEPLIPREIMISLGLDRLELDEEIQAYQFMRLISSAKNVHLIYEENKTKEKSRFIEDLIWAKEKESNTLRALTPQKLSFTAGMNLKKKGVKKTPEIISFLRKRTYSASSLNTYLRNPIEFYYSYVLGLKEQEDFLDEPEAKHIGTFIHEFLENAFGPFLGKEVKIEESFRQKFFKDFDDRFEEVFSRSMKSDAFMLKAVMKERLTRFLDKEQNHIDRAGVKILYLENVFEDVISLSQGDFRFKYIVDRVDELPDKSILLVDYKTGGSDQMPRAVDKIAQMTLSRKAIFEQVKSLQMPLYFHYLSRQFKDRKVNAALYNLRTLDLNFFISDKKNYDYAVINEVFLNVLDFVMNEILDPSIDFVDDKLDNY